MTPEEIKHKILSNNLVLNEYLAEAARIDKQIIKILEQNSDLRARLEDK